MKKTKKKQAKRKDSKGRVLRTGESERFDGSYDYRYTDENHKRRSIYASTLEDLRRKEAELITLRTMKAEDCTSIEEMRRKEAEAVVYAALGIDPTKGEMTTEELVRRYVSQKRNVRQSTQTSYRTVQNLLSKYEIYLRPIKEIKITDAKEFLIRLYDDGYRWNTIASVRGVLRPAFEMAFNEEIIRRNPFDFRLDFLPNNTVKRVALTQKQQQQFLEYVAQDEYYSQYLDEYVILLGTGMRISEFCGLTMSDLDFEKRRIRVDHQLLWTKEHHRHVEKTKTEAGRRFIPMTDEVYRSLLNILANRPKPRKEVMIDGYSGFLLLDNNGNPKVALHIEHVLRRIWEKYNQEHIIQLPNVTPHVFRHTFCTNMANAGMDLKCLQYLMGHADVTVTLNVYTHADYEKAEEAMAKVFPFTSQETPALLRRMG